MGKLFLIPAVICNLYVQGGDRAGQCRLCIHGRIHSSAGCGKTLTTCTDRDLDLTWRRCATPDAAVAATRVVRRVIGHAIVESQANEHWHTVFLVDEGFDVLACGGYGLFVRGIDLWEADRHLGECPVRSVQPIKGHS